MKKVFEKQAKEELAFIRILSDIERAELSKQLDEKIKTAANNNIRRAYIVKQIIVNYPHKAGAICCVRKYLRIMKEEGI